MNVSNVTKNTSTTPGKFFFSSTYLSVHLASAQLISAAFGTLSAVHSTSVDEVSIWVQLLAETIASFHSLWDLFNTMPFL